ncbi:MAG: PhzA/PhzB family protein [Lachnospiraceae bacterium]|nr:PhzA/PhzB family protein [Lachnospiraceae bacterium]
MAAAAPFWRHEYFPEYFAENFTMDIPFAPPGMPQHFDVWESERCFEWLNRTVRSWTVEPEEFYTTPDPGRFWAVGRFAGEVLWGKEPGKFRSKFFIRLDAHEGKIDYIKLWTDPLALLRAAGRDVPVFRMDLYDEKVEEYLEQHPPKTVAHAKAAGDDDEGLDMSAEAVEKRRRLNLETNFCGIEREKYRSLETVNPDFSGGVWFIPHEMDEVIPCRTEQKLDGKDFPPEIAARGNAWTKSSSPWMYRDRRGELFPTDDENVYFAEMHGHGPGRWRGNHCDDGHYHQPYLMVLKFDRAGRMLVRDEVLNPVNKYNCVNISLPSFPYYH